MTEAAARILLVDDLEQNLELLGRLVQSFGYAVETAHDGVEALAKLPLGFDLVLLDVMMPGMDGYEVTRRIRGAPETRDLPIILVTMLDSRDERVRAVEAGASDFIGKPVDRSELRVRILSQLKLKEAQDALRHSQSGLEERVARRTEQLRLLGEEAAAAHRRTHHAHLDTIRRLVLAAEIRDPGIACHILRLSRYSEVLARALRLAPGETEMLAHAVTLHDIGKIGIPDRILFKRGPLTAEERGVIETHTVIGARILADSPSELLQQGQVVALTHHEHWDGGGYPRRLRGSQIPLPGRICAVIDVFDAMTSDRPYRPALPVEEAVAAMRQARGAQFDPVLLDHFLDRLDEVVEVRERLLHEPGPSGRAALPDLPPLPPEDA